MKKQILSLRDDANEREAILNALTEAVLLIDADGRVRQWNKTAGNLFYPEKKDGEIDGQECPEELREYIRQAAQNGSCSAELAIRREEQVFQLLVNAVSFTRAGRCFFLVSVTDLSDIRKLEACRSEFIAAISHEMKTPPATWGVAMEVPSHAW